MTVICGLNSDLCKYHSTNSPFCQADLLVMINQPGALAGCSNLLKSFKGEYRPNQPIQSIYATLEEQVAAANKQKAAAMLTAASAGMIDEYGGV